MHTNLINLYDFHHESDRWFFMEYVDGVDFLEWVRPYNLLIGEHETDHLRLRGALNNSFGASPHSIWLVIYIATLSLPMCL